MNIISIIMLGIKLTFGIIVSDSDENTNDIINAMIIIFIVQLSFFIKYPFINKKMAINIVNFMS